MVADDRRLAEQELFVTTTVRSARVWQPSVRRSAHLVPIRPYGLPRLAVDTVAGESAPGQLPGRLLLRAGALYISYRFIAFRLPAAVG